eukprot:TRINITY_DN7596_c0_g7_i2.p2 TRINITY_DN7596_c0_g7~~TRINITY_DN7596_c0_g7_i2.p2  ORF type:complete len:168 (+),score=4.98 TRINITY_DN7596_c0_g7_i2:234-737(+)
MQVFKFEKLSIFALKRPGRSIVTFHVQGPVWVLKCMGSQTQKYGSTCINITKYCTICVDRLIFFGGYKFMQFSFECYPFCFQCFLLILLLVFILILRDEEVEMMSSKLLYYDGDFSQLVCRELFKVDAEHVKGNVSLCFQFVLNLWVLVILSTKTSFCDQQMAWVQV